MRIFGGFRNYYDVGAAWDTDPKPVYQRLSRTTVLTTSSAQNPDWKAENDDPAAEQVLRLLWHDLLHVPEFS